MKYFTILFAAFLTTQAAFADAPEIVGVKAHSTGMGWDFEVTVKHDDTGWDHFADAWEILDADGTVLGTRVLHHPHVNEQPFTRGLRNIMLPDGMREVFVRVKCSKNGWKDSRFKVALTR